MIVSSLLIPEYSGSKENPIYHRNGVAGQGFHLYLTEDALYLKFNTDHDYKTYKLSDFALLVDCPLQGEIFKNKCFDAVQFRNSSKLGDTSLYAFDCEGNRMIGIYNPDLDDIAFAAFNWDLLLKGEMRFAFNSYRGDQYQNALFYMNKL